MITGYKTKNAAERSRIYNQNKAVFAPRLLKIRARHLYSHNYFEQEIKNAVFFAQFT